MHGPVTPRARRSTVAVSAVAILWCMILALPAGALAQTPTTTVGNAPGATPAEVALAEFPGRAGYAAAYAGAVVGSTPAVAPEAIDVVFTPRSSSAPPSSGSGVVPVGSFARTEGLSPAQYASAEQYFASFGVEVRHVWPDRLALSLEGRPAALDAAFHTTLRAGTYQGRPVVYPSTPPSLPVGLGAQIAGVIGLSSGFQPFTVSLSPATPVRGASSLPGQPGNNTITPEDARAYYNVSQVPTNARSAGIALILWGAGYDPDDIQSFFANDYPSTLPTPNITAYPIDGAPTPSPDALGASDRQAVQELTLDIEWSGSMASAANLSVIYPPGPSAVNLTDALETALSIPGVVAISMSFGAAEASDSSLAASWGALFNEATTRRITVLAASGDYGGYLNASCVGGPAPDFPSSSAQVIAVGGTYLSPRRNAFGTIVGYNETGWSGSGGGYSALYAAPDWQKFGSAGAAINASGGGRGLPDVSATAVNDFLYFAGANQEADGTSFATPLWAGIVADLDAEIGSPLGFFTDRLYHVAAYQSAGSAYDGLRDIQGGKNCVATSPAGPGWDVVTGWGSPQAQLLYYELVGSFVNLSIDERPTTLPPGGSVTVRTEVTNWTTGQGVADVPVTFDVASDTSVGPCTGVFDTVETVSNGTGAAQATLMVPFCYFGAHAILQVRVATSKLFGTNETHVAVNLLGFAPSLESLGSPPGSYVLFAGIMAAAIAGGGWIGRRKGPPPALPAMPKAPGNVPIATPVRPPPPPGPPPPAVPVSGPPTPVPAGTPPPGQISQKT